METVSHALYRLLSQDWAGLLLAGIVLALAVAAHFLFRRKWPAYAIAGLAVVLAGGAVVHMIEAKRLLDESPAPGRTFEVDGMQLHILAEGNTNNRPTVVLFGGGHSPGTAMSHLHRDLRSDHRSVLIDRPGTGWSGPARFPLSTAREADMMWALLDAAGESGPYVLAGHSFGGLLAANMARRKPERVHALVLLDPTPPDAIVYGPRLGDLSTLRTEPFWRGLLALFALDYDAVIPKPDMPPAHARLEQKIAAAMGEAHGLQKRFSALPRAQMAAASIYRELSPAGMAVAGWDVAVFDGELRDMPLYLVAPQTQLGLELLPEMQDAEAQEALRLQRFYSVVRERSMAMSSASVRVAAPPETGHNFIYEDPAFTLEALREAARK